MLTIKDIAMQAGVSKSTVSRVLTNNGYVSEEARAKIERVIEENHFRPSASAQFLSKRETNTIGVIIPEMDNYFFSELLYGMMRVLDENNLTMICCNTDNDFQKEEKALNLLESQRVRGVIMTPAISYSEINSQKKLLKLLRKLNAPIVLVDRVIENAPFDGVFYENYQSAYKATEVLIQQGYKKIGVITGDLRLQIGRERLQGYKDAMSDYGMELYERYVYEGDFTIQKAYEITNEMIESHDMPEGILTCNNLTSLGFIKSIREHNMKLGREIAVIGIDHDRTLDIIGYNFSYVSRDVNNMGQLGARLLLERIADPGKERSIIMVPCVLKLNGSEKLA